MGSSAVAQKHNGRCTQQNQCWAIWSNIIRNEYQISPGECQMLKYKPEDRAILIAREHCHLWKGFKKGKLKFNTMIDWNTLKSMLKIWNEIQFPVAELKNLYSFPAKSYFIGTWLECRMGRLSFVELTRLLLQYYECFSVIAKINIHISPLHLYTISASKSKVLRRFSNLFLSRNLVFHILP